MTVEQLIATLSAVEARLFGRLPNLEAVRLAEFQGTLRQIGVGDDGLAACLNTLYLHHRFANIVLDEDARYWRRHAVASRSGC